MHQSQVTYQVETPQSPWAVGFPTRCSLHLVVNRALQKFRTADLEDRLSIPDIKCCSHVVARVYAGDREESRPSPNKRRVTVGVKNPTWFATFGEALITPTQNGPD